LQDLKDRGETLQDFSLKREQLQDRATIQEFWARAHNPIFHILQEFEIGPWAHIPASLHDPATLQFLS